MEGLDESPEMDTSGYARPVSITNINCCAITRLPPATGQKERRGVNLLTMLGQLDQDRLVKGTQSEQEQ